MSRLTHNFPVKVLAIFLFVIVTIALIGGAIGIFYMTELHFYESSIESAKEIIFEDITRSYANQVFFEYYPAYKHNDAYSAEYLQGYQEKFSTENTNFIFVLRNGKGEVVLSNDSNQEIQFTRTYSYEFYEEYWPEEMMETGVPADVPAEGEIFTLECHVKQTLTADDRYSAAEYWIHLTYSMRYTIIAITILSLVASILLFIFLMCSAGRRRGRGEIIPNGLDKIPFDILLAAILFIAFIVVVFLDSVYFGSVYFGSIIATIILTTISLAVSALLLLLLSMSFATRCKLGGWWKNTMIYRILRFIYRVIHKIVLGIKYLLQHLSLLWKAILGLFVLSVVELFIIMATSYRLEMLIVLWLFGKLIFVPAILFIIIHMQKLQIGSQKIASGDLDYRIDTRHLFWDFKQHGENLNNISVGMSKAVDERMKSERLKTELITNVSHDIKTPLTSIINYVDLLKREEMEEEIIK